MNKHAYLILAHAQFGLLKKLLTVLDSPYHDIYVHVDKKARDFQPAAFRNLTKFSQVTFIKRKRLNWGDYTLVDAELRLLQAAAPNHYSYYHLLSGQDLPLVPVAQIYQFCESTQKDYLSWGSDFQAWHHRFATYKLFLGKRTEFARRLTEFSDNLQRKLGINRVQKSGLDYLKGDQWFSITQPLCQFILAQAQFIKRTFRYTSCPDETVFQSLAYSSPYRANMCNDSLRYIDWSQGGSHPKTLTDADRDRLQNSPKLFARKFDEVQSRDLITWVLTEKLKQS